MLCFSSAVQLYVRGYEYFEAVSDIVTSRSRVDHKRNGFLPDSIFSIRANGACLARFPKQPTCTCWSGKIGVGVTEACYREFACDLTAATSITIFVFFPGKRRLNCEITIKIEA